MHKPAVYLTDVQKSAKDKLGVYCAWCWQQLERRQLDDVEGCRTAMIILL
jgi:hypothetical protein